MKRILVVCLLALIPVVTSTPAGAKADAATMETASFAGTWKGTMNDLPGIALTIRQRDRKISGEVVFYFQKRADENSPWLATADPALPLLNPNVNGRILTFEVEHHVCDGCKQLGPNAAFRMELAGVNAARITRFDADGTETGPQVKLVRSNATSSQAAPPLQRGITVEMPVTASAAPTPEADQEDALIVAVTREGNV